MEKIVNFDDEQKVKDSLVKTRNFLECLVLYDKVPDYIKIDAVDLLENYPTDYHITRIFNK